MYQISSTRSHARKLCYGKERRLHFFLSSGCLTSFLVRCMCPLSSLRQNDLTVAEIELFRYPSWRSCRLSPYAQSIGLPSVGGFVHSVRNVPCELLSTEVASRFTLVFFNTCASFDVSASMTQDWATLFCLIAVLKLKVRRSSVCTSHRPPAAAELFFT